ncbi:hypothetical protein [Mycoplasma crocodyli]|uniref:Putative lipoprotein n=1 Tax=Mycoplasma crocodyli (strain ATCC 51981 / MP145) TaxID=512564 RepID=D5E5V9_MYCCM|nr:hypothetical protein [Mycoplasma crocodyli]ADE19393.1 putative lipoprotein [Mycoplasma crocodyli MP145]
MNKKIPIILGNISIAALSTFAVSCNKTHETQKTEMWKNLKYELKNEVKRDEKLAKDIQITDIVVTSLNDKYTFKLDSLEVQTDNTNLKMIITGQYVSKKIFETKSFIITGFKKDLKVDDKTTPQPKPTDNKTPTEPAKPDKDMKLGKLETLASENKLIIVDKKNQNYSSTIQKIKDLIGQDGAGRSTIKFIPGEATKVENIKFKFGQSSKKANNDLEFLKFSSELTIEEIQNIIPPENYNNGAPVERNRRWLFFSYNETKKLIIKIRIKSESSPNKIFVVELE